MPETSPWPAPTPADAATHPPDSDRVEPSHRRPVGSLLLNTARRLGSRTERAQHAAAKDEQKIRDDLADLPAGWFVLPSIDIAELVDDDHRVDHVAIGPGGVYVIYLEHRSGARVWVSERTVTIDGHDTDRLRRARFEARRAGGQLSDMCGFSITVQAVLVLIGATSVQTLSRPAEVHVRTEHDLRDWLCKQPPRLDSDTVRAIRDRLLPATTPAMPAG